MKPLFSRLLFGSLTTASPWRWVQSLLFIVGGSYLGLTLYLFVFQARFIYLPSARIHLTPSDFGLSYQDLWLPVGEGDALVHGWSIPAASDNDSGRWVLFCHGNGGNISHRLPLVELLHDMGYSTLIFDYRGYGQSSGRPSERKTYADAAAAWRWLVEEQGVEAGRIMVFGRSLGGAVAAWLAKEKNPGLLVVESSFTSIVDMGRMLYPFLPVAWLTLHRYPTLRHVADYNGPVLFMHSVDDEMIPLRMGRELYAAAAAEKLFFELRGGHNDVWQVMGAEYREILSQGAERLWQSPPALEYRGSGTP